MTDIKELDARLTAAFSRIETALKGQPSSAQMAKARDVIAEHAKNIDTLRSELEAMREQRKRDAADVDAILNDLKPMLEA